MYVSIIESLQPSHSSLAHHLDQIYQMIPSLYSASLNSKAPEHRTHINALRLALNPLVFAADVSGPFFAGASLSLVDIALAPWMVRFKAALGTKGWNTENVQEETGSNGLNGHVDWNEQVGKIWEEGNGERWRLWEDAVMNEGGVLRTICGSGFYSENES